MSLVTGPSLRRRPSLPLAWTSLLISEALVSYGTLASLHHSLIGDGTGLPEPGQSWAAVSLVNEPGAPTASPLHDMNELTSSVHAGHSTYPVVTFSYAIVRQDMSGRGEKGAAVANFIRYVNQVREMASEESAVGQAGVLIFSLLC